MALDIAVWGDGFLSNVSMLGRWLKGLGYMLCIWELWFDPKHFMNS